MAESAIINTSIALYHYLCQNIVGKEKDVKSIRLVNNIRDNLQSCKGTTVITSGSFGEGLLMRGSDIDLMGVVKLIEVCEDTQIYFNADRVYFEMELEDTQPGFTKLRLVHSIDWNILEDCNTIGDDLKGFSYNILGIGFQMLGDKEAARLSFMQSIELFPIEKHNSAFKTLSLIN
ncbi:unnamed protein product [Mytilus edulis]|uniref:Uncharacterized protein n=1 Tax=Mytilus edulis TaxID=6550 RepID=A0A8S3PQU0_MYTED|nr:unnamed protein product [Mytilus edulis]